MSTWLLCLLAFLAMVGEDLTYTWMVQAQARNLWVLAGVMDSAGFLLQVATFGVSIDAVVNHGLTSRTVWVLIALTAANFVGTGLGTLLGSRWIHANNLGPAKP